MRRARKEAPLAQTAATPLTLELGVPLALAANAPPPPEKPLREDDKRFRDKAGPKVVPLSYLVHEGIWAFRLVDVVVDHTYPAVASSVSGTTRISAKIKKAAAEDKPVELAVRRNSSGLHVPRTRTILKRDPDKGSYIVNDDGTVARETSLIRRDGRELRRDEVGEVIFDNDLYEIERRAAVGLEPVTTVSLLAKNANNPKRETVVLFGEAPPNLEAGTVTLRPRDGNAVLAEAPIERGRRFMLRGSVAAIFGGAVPPPNAAEVTVRLAAPPPRAPVELDYQLLRENAADPEGAVADANHTTRTKLRALRGGIPPADVPPLHLTIN